MKNGIYILLLFLNSFSGTAQNNKFQIPERGIPTAKKEKMAEAVYINDISPLLWSSMGMANQHRYYLDQRKPGVFPQPENFIYPQDNYKQILDVTFVEITGICNGKYVTAQSGNDKLTGEQKNILATADLGTDIKIRLTYKYKDQSMDKYGLRNEAVDCSVLVTVLPEKQAEFPGGYKQLSDYFAGHVIDKCSEENAIEKVQRATIRFVVDEKGQVANARLSQSTTDKNIDKLLLDAINKMPKWIPAANANGVNVKQQVLIPFNIGC